MGCPIAPACGTVGGVAYDVLFEPVPIGPVVTRNRFFQVPHCNGMGYRDPSAEAAMRGVKAEGGWAVVCTEETEIGPSSDLTPSIELRLWDDRDVPAVARIADRIHEHGALAGIELVHNGMHAANLTSRIPPMGPSALPVVGSNHPVQARAMTLADIALLREMHRAAVRRALSAGYDLIYVYAAHGYGMLEHFLSPQHNHRLDEYGGSLRNRARLLREVLADTRELCAGKAAVACRLGVGGGAEETALSAAETREVVHELRDLPDLWDFVVGPWSADSNTSRFGPEGEQEEAVRGLKSLTSKPVVGVGRFTSPDAMVRQIRSGVLDFIGAARPSIADPFLPWKIRDGRLDEIRECIGCNICVSGDHTQSPIRCTQNPSMGEEWRRGWHPERLRPRGSDATVLVVGAGPAGLEAAMSLGRRGYQVTLIERSRVLGGRVRREAALPGLAAWTRVADYREAVLGKLDTVELYYESELTADDVLEHGFSHVAVATGARWRADGVGRQHPCGLAIDPAAEVLTPDDVMAGARPRGRHVVVYDDDHYYIGAVLAELLAREGFAVELVTPAASVSEWTANTMELTKIRRRVIEAGIIVHTNRSVVSVAGVVRTACVFTGSERDHAADSVVLVTARTPIDDLSHQLLARQSAWTHLRSVRAIGDAFAPSTIAAAVWAGREYAETLDAVAEPFRREITELAP
ncbi:dimethylamine/trimethylamine dehydrogenase [Kutzneria buriramensis]|uniref:Dimethylamine/trimethylamine dehydrogenase n=1 Tax=Kutzneria buriramensis TaxID=1045776 RepID=A0A3E0HQJ2_9PSEU|nr:dimethylamine/trimethylamine dehydrogenase [Kutzneria buriramensis]